MEIKTVEEINQYIGTTVNPLDNPDTVYELYSVPSFESQHPEIIKGEDIGSSKITVEDGDVLVCKINPRINRVWVVKWHTSYPLLASSEWIVIRNCDIDSDYLKWYFSSPTFRNLLVSQVAGIGGSLTRAQPKQVAKYPVPLVGKEEQRRIATTLDKVSDLIAKRRAQLDKLDLLVKVRFVELFGDPVKNDKGLPTMMGQNFFKLSNGKFVPENKRFDKGIPAYGGNGISWYTDETLYEENTIVVGRVGFQSGNVHFVKGPLWITDNAMYISNYNTSKYDLFFLYVLMEHIDFTRFQDAGDLKKITQKPFMSMEYIMPTLSRQREYVAFAKQIDKSKLTIQQSLDKLETLKKALMQQYFG